MPLNIGLERPLSESRYWLSSYFYRTLDERFDDNRYMGIGGIVKAQRLARGLTQIPFAKEVGISQSSLADIENDHTQKMRAETLLKLADYLNLHPNYLMTQKGPEVWSAADTEQEKRLLDAFRELDAESRAEVVGRVLGMLDAMPRSSRADPFKNVPRVITIEDEEVIPPPEPVKALPAPKRKGRPGGKRK